MKKQSIFSRHASRFELLLEEQEKQLDSEIAQPDEDDTGGQLPPNAALPPPVGTDAATDAQNQSAADTSTPDSDVAPAPTGEALTSEGEITLIRLMKQAFIAKPDDMDAVTIEGLGEVTSDNAKQQLDAVSNLLLKYNGTPQV